jgi:hypothetical protein
VKLPAPAKGRASASTRKQAEHDLEKAKTHKKPSAKRSRSARAALKDESQSVASSKALSRQAKSAARKRSPAARHKSAVKAAKTRAAH